MIDKLFIFITIVLLVLFVFTVLENIPFGRGPLRVPYQMDSEDTVDASGILIRLEEAGLEPQEAEYYQVMDE